MNQLTGATRASRRNRVVLVSAAGTGAAAVWATLRERTAALARLADIEATPMYFDTAGTDETVAAVRAVAANFAAVALHDIAGPASSDLERRLRHALDIPVYHDAQHGLPVVVLAALRNALRHAGKHLEAARVVVMGTGAAGSAVTRLLLHAGVRDVTVWTRHGILSPDLPGLPPRAAWLATCTNPQQLRGDLAAALTGADAVIGLSAPGLLDRRLVAAMAPPPVVFALARPEPELQPAALAGLRALTATARPEHPNQITDLPCCPGMLRGLLNADVPRITTSMLLAAADVLGGLVPDELLGPFRLLPHAGDPQLVQTMTAAIAAVDASRRRAALPD